MNRETILQAARERFERPVWALLSELEVTLQDVSRAQHVDISDLRAVGSLLNCALPDAASEVGLEAQDMEILYCRNGQSNKIAGTLAAGKDDLDVSFELHLCGPRGGTSKSAHQFAGYDIEAEPTFPTFEFQAPPSLLLFIACFLNGTGTRFERVFLKFADGVDQAKIEIFRDVEDASTGIHHVNPAEGPAGAVLRIKTRDGEERKNGGKTDQRGDAASGS